MNFEWDKGKAEKNERKHGVSFYEAATIFSDPLAITYSDPDHSIDEQRYLTFGVSRFNRLIIVSHTDNKEGMRIISARLMTKQERKNYEEEQF